MSKSTTEPTQDEAKPAKPQKMTKAAAAQPSLPAKKPNIILNMLSRAKGADIAQLKKATGWQSHSIRAAISIFRKKGITISRSQAKDGATLYHATKA